MNTRTILADLLASAIRLREIKLDDEAGAYVVLIDEPEQLATVPVAASKVIYLGISGSLLDRDLRAHFSTGATGSSTLRRSLGAILREQLRLPPMPRGRGKHRRDYTHYRFDESGEERLTDWMNARLRLGIRKLADPNSVEGELIRLARPPLNLTEWENPWGPTLRRLRAACVREALSSFPLKREA